MMLRLLLELLALIGSSAEHVAGISDELASSDHTATKVRKIAAVAGQIATNAALILDQKNAAEAASAPAAAADQQ